MVAARRAPFGRRTGDQEASNVADGTIKKLVGDRGFGFIADNEGKEVFFHRSQVVGDFASLQEGQKVTFEMGTDPRRNKPQAEKVTPA
jgi:CspA family cold shock protein